MALSHRAYCYDSVDGFDHLLARTNLMTELGNKEKVEELLSPTKLLPILMGWEIPSEARDLPESVTLSREDLKRITLEIQMIEEAAATDLLLARAKWDILKEIATNPSIPTPQEEELATKLARHWEVGGPISKGDLSAAYELIATQLRKARAS